MFRGKSATNGEGQTGGVPFNRLGVAAEEQNRTDKEAEDEQEDLWIYEPEMAVLLHGASFGRRDRRNRRIRPLRSGFAPLVGVLSSPCGGTHLPLWSV